MYGHHSKTLDVFLHRIPIKSHFQRWLGNLQRSNCLIVIGTNYQSVMIPAKSFFNSFSSVVLLNPHSICFVTPVLSVSHLAPE